MEIQQLIQNIMDRPVPALLIVCNLVIIESLLSVDNAAVLATMVMDLPKKKRKLALKYGIIGAYLFRGLALLFATFLVQFWYLKPLGGMYLIYLLYDWWQNKSEETAEDAPIDKNDKWLYKNLNKFIGNFWSTVLLVELMDVAFSIDNVFAAVAFSDNIVLIWIGVFIGILAMRFVAQIFITLMEKYPFLETCAFVVIGLLGLKLTMSFIPHFYPESKSGRFLESHEADWMTSGLTILIFLIPFLIRIIFYHPKRNKDFEI
jgi:YkoY family integral membrane protein